MEFEVPNTFMDSELFSIDTELFSKDTQPLDSEMQLDILDTEPLEMEVPTPNVEEPQPVKRRKKKSIVWEHFTIETAGPGCRRACCNQCKQSFAYSTGSKVSGTSHLKRHIAKGTCSVVLHNQEKNNQTSSLSAPSKREILSDTQPKRRSRIQSVPYAPFDADRCRQEITKMIIMHGYPLHMVEHPGFLAFIQNLQPRFGMVSFNTIQGDCVATFVREKQTIQRVIEGMPGRICLSLDLWHSCRGIGYILVTGQFIDSDWRMHRKLLNVIMEPYPDSDTSFSHSVAVCLSDWSINGKLFSVTINQPLNNDAVDNLRALLSVKNPLVSQLLVGNCLARSLSGVVQNALASAYGIVKKVRDCVKYVQTSESREEKFLETKHQLQVPSSKILAIDNQTQWNTTYEMLLAASELKEVFSCLDTLDPDYKSGPSAEDWSQIETLCTYLKPLFITANLLTSSTTLTANTFFEEACNIRLLLARATTSEDLFVSNMTKSMQEEFDKYWKSCCYILAIAVVMDPRFKMKFVEFKFLKIYGEEAASYVEVVNERIHKLFLEYIALPLPLTPSYTEEPNVIIPRPEDHHQEMEISSDGLGLTDFDVHIMEEMRQLSKSELDQYLEESLLPRVHEFDVVGWWKVNTTKYPTLSKMARDILSITVCTVPAASVFDTIRKEMDSYRCLLRPETVEALICAKDWLQAEKVEQL